MSHCTLHVANRLVHALCVVLVLFALGSRSRVNAQQASAQVVRGTILHMDGEDIVIDLGKASVADAQTLTVYRSLEVRHPITHRTLRDRFAIGSLAIVQRGDTLSVAKASGTPAHPFAVGDAVELVIPATVSAATPATKNEDVSPSPASVPVQNKSAPPATPSREERELAAAWYATLAKTPEERARIYAALLERYPDSRYRAFLVQEISYLRALAAQLRARDQRAREGNTREMLASSVTLLPLHSAPEGEAVDLGALVKDRARVRSLLLHARPLESPDYVTYPVAIDERGHARVKLPAAVAQAPGFAYFMEAIDKDGRAVAAVGTARSPEIVVVKSAKGAPLRNEPSTSVRFSSEIVSFDGTSGRDYFLLTEGDFLYRVRFGRLYGLRVGYGNYRGQGGTVDELDRQHLAPRPAGFSYGFVETELELDRLFGLAARGTVGLGRPDDPESQRKGLTGGFQLRARIGAADGTHLVLAGELMPEIGQRAYLGLRFSPIRQMPMAAEVVVTDQPVHSDELAVRLIYEVGYRVTDRIALALRPSYELRTIAHAGPGIGLAATFDW